jgi:isocitrate lyase
LKFLLLIVARTDADAADLLTSDIDERDRKFITGERTPEGFFQVNCGVEQGIDRGLSYAPYADLIWMETSNPDLEYARKFAEGIHANSQEKCWLTIVHLHSIGQQNYQLQKWKHLVKN